jgi:hypothetical protein
VLAHLIHLCTLIAPPPTPPDPGLTSSWLCPWLCSADGPSQPFSTPLIVVSDILRLVCSLLGLICLSLLGTAVAYAGSRDHRMRFYALGAFILVAVTTEAVHMGDDPSYRLILNVLGCLAATWGLWRFDQQIKELTTS